MLFVSYAAVCCKKMPLVGVSKIIPTYELSMRIACHYGTFVKDGMVDGLASVLKIEVV